MISFDAITEAFSKLEDFGKGTLQFNIGEISNLLKANASLGYHWSFERFFDEDGYTEEDFQANLEEQGLGRGEPTYREVVVFTENLFRYVPEIKWDGELIADAMFAKYDLVSKYLNIFCKSQEAS
ncbi:MAG: hypothetical protein AAGM67_15620 [Bacteroidota bacterium]